MVTAWVTAGSASWKFGRYLTTGSDQLTVPSVTACAMTVLPIDFETDANWNTVFSSTVSGLPTSLTP